MLAKLRSAIDEPSGVIYINSRSLLMKNCALLIIILHILIYDSVAQTLGIPAIKNYTQNDHRSSTEIWDAKQGKNGLLYFANDNGLLTFDGSYWKTYPLPNGAAVKSIAIDPDGRIYAGGQDEIGYFFPNNAGILKFHSLKQLLPQSAKQFADIWRIEIYKNEVFFMTYECILQLKNNKLYAFDAPGGWMMLNQAVGRLFAYDTKNGLVEFSDSKWQPCVKQKTTGLGITSITEFNDDTLLVTTRKKGLFFISSFHFFKAPIAINSALKTDLINSCKKLTNNRYAICTAAKGMLVINEKGKLIELFSIKQGLQSNNIHSLLLDNENNLWLGLENGLDLIDYSTSVKNINPNRDNQVRTTAVNIFSNELYVGSSNGLYSIPLNHPESDVSLSTGTFKEVKNTKGQILSLTQLDGHLLAGHQDGVLLIDEDKAKNLTAGPGAWMVKPIAASPDVIAGTYTGLQLLKYQDGKFNFESKIPGIYESLDNIVIDNNNYVWATHPYRGIFKIQLSADRKHIISYKHFDQKNRLPSAHNNHIYFIKGKIIAATEKGIYEYNAKLNSFDYSHYYRPIFAKSRVEFLTEDKTGNIWFISDQKVGVVEFNKKKHSGRYKVTYFPELSGKPAKGAEYIYPYNSENIFVGSSNGVYHLNYSRYVSAKRKLSVVISTVKAIGQKDSIIFGGYFIKNNRIASYQNSNQITSLSKQWNSFHLEYTSTAYAQKSNLEFSYRLIGFDKNWSAWSVKTEKDYTNLPYGKYTFSVMVRNNLGKASAPANYTFIVQPAWYQTVWAYTLYVLLTGYLIYLAINYQQKTITKQRQKHEDEQKRLNYLHSLELDRNIKEIITLKNDKLEAELSHKNTELATLTMEMMERSKLLRNLNEELMAMIKKLNLPDASHQFKSVFKMLGDTEKSDNDWEKFSLYFDQVHNNFLTTIRAKFPSLSSTDLKLCAYLRLNLSSKEIAQLLNISLKGVEVSRYRLRKKLQLPTEINLYDFLIEISSQPNG